MDFEQEPHKNRIQRAGRLLWLFSLIWLVLNSLALLLAISAVVGLKAMGGAEGLNQVISMFTHEGLVPGLDSEAIKNLVSWDYQTFLDHFWLTLFYYLSAGVLFTVTMFLILKIASSWKQNDVFGDKPIRCFRILGWIYLIHGIIGQGWGMAGQFIGASNTCDLIYFSYLRDVGLYSFTMSGTGIEWGFLCLTLSWILKHAQLALEEQKLVI
jgi:hypothetical protein